MRTGNRWDLPSLFFLQQMTGWIQPFTMHGTSQEKQLYDSVVHDTLLQTYLGEKLNFCGRLVLLFIQHYRPAQETLTNWLFHPWRYWTFLTMLLQVVIVFVKKTPHWQNSNMKTQDLLIFYKVYFADKHISFFKHQTKKTTESPLLQT